MEPDDAVKLCEEILDDLDYLPEDAEEFGDSVREKVEGIRDWVSEKGRVTDKQSAALENMQAGVSKWTAG